MKQVQNYFALQDTHFVQSQITPSSILEGNPVTRVAYLSSSGDNSVAMMAWDCTAGKFKWYFNEDETIVVVEGEARISVDGGPEKVLRVGDVAYFPSGSAALWQVDSYVRKVAFLRKPMPRTLSFLLRAVWKVRLKLIPLHSGVGQSALG